MGSGRVNLDDSALRIAVEFFQRFQISVTVDIGTDRKGMGIHWIPLAKAFCTVARGGATRGVLLVAMCQLIREAET